MLARWGHAVHRRRGWALTFSVVLLAASLAALAQGGDLLTYQPPEDAESTRAFDAMQQELPGFSESSFMLIFSSPTLDARGDEFRARVDDAVAPLLADARVDAVTTPWTEGQIVDSMISRDGHKAIVVVALKASANQARAEYAGIREQVRPQGLDVIAGGDLAINANFEDTLQSDLKRAELITVPLTLLLLFVVFGTFVAALLPLGVGLLAVAGGIGAVLAVSHRMDVSVYAVNVVTLIGLGVAIDYSLFVVNRFREELARGRTPEHALARTMATAGRAVLFSGLTVAVGLLGLSFYRGMYFASMGLAGAFVVAFAIVYSLVFLPALLAFLGPRVNKLRVPFVRGGTAAPGATGMWHSIATTVMRRPALFLVVASTLVLVAAAPFLHLRMATATEQALPEGAEGRVGTEILRSEFPGGGLTSFLVVVEYPDDPLTSDRVGAMFDYSRALAAIPGVDHVSSIVDLDPSIAREGYQQAYGDGRDAVPSQMRAAVDRFVGARVVVLDVESAATRESDEARRIVDDIRALPPPPGAESSVTGLTAFDVDTLQLIGERTPYALAFILVATYVLLLIQTGSPILPLKALVMNVLSIAAAFGAMVWIFQDGNLSAILGFTPAPIDPSLPVLLFCIVFGLSMDYEVLLLSRMAEEYERTGDNTTAVAVGLEKSGRLITSAAAIMVLVFGAFATAQVTIIKAIGLGLAIAIFIDATLVRALIVPSAMRLMGRWNWWAPGPLRRLQRQLREDA